MDRLFFRFFLARPVGDLSLAALLAWLAVVPRLTQRISRNMEDALSVTVAVMVESIAAEPRQPSGRARSPERARLGLRAPVTLLPRAEITLSQPMRRDWIRARLSSIAVACRRRFVYADSRRGSDAEARPAASPAPVWRRASGDHRGPAVERAGRRRLSALRPTRKQLNELAQAAEAFGRGALHSRATVHSRDAIGALARSFNAMAAQIQALIVAQKELLWMVSHELRWTPLQRVYFALEQLHGTADNERRQDGYLKAERHPSARRLDESSDYVRLSHDELLRREAVDLDLLIDETLETQADLAGQISLVRGEGTLPSAIAVEPKLLRRALDNLIGNALRYAQSGCVGQRLAGARPRADRCPKTMVQGFRKPSAGRIFEPFMRLEVGGDRVRQGVVWG